jgi:hypothetical protein
MKQEIILKAADILKQIDQIEKARAIIALTHRIDLDVPNKGTYGSIFFSEEKGQVNLNNTTLTKEVQDHIVSETLRFPSRVKRILENYEFNLKQELEDL